MEKSGRNLLNGLLSEGKVDLSRITEMRREHLFVAALKATGEQLVDDLNGVLSNLQKQMMLVMFSYIDELTKHIKDLDDAIDQNMKDEEKLAVAQIQEITGIGNTSAETIIIYNWCGYVPLPE